jgi:hypothetical protein
MFPPVANGAVTGVVFTSATPYSEKVLLDKNEAKRPARVIDVTAAADAEPLDQRKVLILFPLEPDVLSSDDASMDIDLFVLLV